jgi:hypothetical protein
MELSTKESTYQASLEQEIVSKQALIAGLDENEVYDANMKYILAKVLEARHPSFEDFTSPEWEGIYGLALQCAKDAGHAVYWARSLYNASHNWVDFKGIEDCNTLQARSASEEETLGHPVNVFPNPSMEIFTFAWPMKVEAQLTIVDVQGRVQQTTTIRQGDNLVSLKDAPEGVYYFMIESEGNITRRGKLLLVK